MGCTTSAPGTVASPSSSRIPLITAPSASPCPSPSTTPSKYAVDQSLSTQPTTPTPTSPTSPHHHLHYLPVELHSLILDYLSVPELGLQECLQHKPSLSTLLGLSLNWRQRCKRTYSLYSSQGYRKVGGIVVSNRTHTLSWKNLYKLRSHQPNAQFLQFRTSTNDTFVVPIKKASQRPRSCSAQEEQWFLQITSDKVLGGGQGKGGAPSPPRRRLRGIDVLRTVARGRKRTRSSKHINHKLRVRRASNNTARTTRTATNVIVLVMCCVLAASSNIWGHSLLVDAAPSNFERVSRLDSGNTILFGDPMCVEDQISGTIMVSNTMETETAQQWRHERRLLHALYKGSNAGLHDDREHNNTAHTENKRHPVVTDTDLINAKMNARYGTDEPAHECKESTYGELTHGTLQSIIHHPKINLLANESFLDVGSGRGATSIQVVLAKNLTFSAGVELSTARHNQACFALAQLTKMQGATSFRSTITFSNDNMFAMDWSMFNVVYVSALCFRRSMMNEIQHKFLVELQEGSRIFSLREFPPLEQNEESSPRLVLAGTSVGRATWGPTTVYMYRKVGGRAKNGKQGKGKAWSQSVVLDGEGDGGSSTMCSYSVL
jgi:hypothetical protein